MNASASVSESRAAVEELHQRAADAADIGVFARDYRTGRGFWSRKCYEFCGLPYSPEPPSPDWVDEKLIHPEDRAARQHATKTSREDPRCDVTRICFRIVRSDLGIRHIEMRIHYQRDQAGRAVGSEGVVLDVTAQCEAEAALSLERERFHHAAEIAGLGVLDRDIATGQATWSPQMWKIYGLEPRLTPPSWEEVERLLHPEDRSVLPVMRQAMLLAKQDHPARFDFRIIRPDGQERHISASVQLICDSARRPVCFRGALVDVTESHEAENALRAEKERFQVTAEATGLGVFERNLATGVNYWSPRSRVIWGLPADEPGPSVDEILATVHPDDRHVVAGAMMRVLASDDQRAVRTEFRIVRPDGSVRYLLANALLVRDAGGRPHRILGLLHDITEQKRDELALIEERERFRQAVELAGLGVVERDFTTGEGRWSPRTWEIYGMEPEARAPTQAEAAVLFHPEDRDNTLETRTAWSRPSMWWNL